MYQIVNATSVIAAPPPVVPNNPTWGTVTFTYDGLNVILSASLTPPSPLGSYEGAYIYLDAPDRSTGGPPTSWTPQLIGWTKSGNSVEVVVPAPKEAELWRLYAAPGSPDIDVRPVPFGAPGASASVQFTVNPPPAAGVGTEYCPLVTGLSQTTSYSNDEAGNQIWRVRLTWTWPTSGTNLELFRGVTVWREDGSNKTAVTTIPSSAAGDWYSDWELVPPSSTQYRFSLTSFDSENRENTLVLGVTPSILVTVVRQNGSAGQEYAPFVTGFSITSTLVTSASGTVMSQLDASWSNPSDSRFGGVEIWYVTGANPAKQLQGLGASIAPSQAFINMPPTVQSWTFYAVSVDTSGRRNTITGSTPSSTINIGTTTNQLNLAKAFNFGAEFNVSGLFSIATGGVANIHLAAGSVDTLKLTTGQIDVGGGGSKPIRFRVFDNFGSLTGWVGDDSGVSGYVGAWFKQFRFGGSSPANAKFIGDSAGNSSILDATFQITKNSIVTKLNHDAAMGYFTSFLTHDTGNNSPVMITPGVIQAWNNLFGTTKFFLGTGSGLHTVMNLYDNGGTVRLIMSAAAGITVRDGSIVVKDAFNTTRWQVFSDGLVDFRGGTSTSAIAGANAVPGTADGFIWIYVNGNLKKIAYYNF